MFERRLLSEPSVTERGMRLLLIVLMLFALWHVSQHELPSTVGADNTAHCEICRLNHIPFLGSVALALAAALFVCVTPLALVDNLSLRSKSYLPHFPRGPPPV